MEKSAEVTKNKGPRTSIFEFLKSNEMPDNVKQPEKIEVKSEIMEEQLPEQMKVIRKIFSYTVFLSDDSLEHHFKIIRRVLHL